MSSGVQRYRELVSLPGARVPLLASGLGSLAIGLKSLWLGATPTAIWRIDPKRVEATLK